MRKFLLTLAVLCGTVSGWAQTSLRISDGLLTTQENSQYKWTSAKLTAPTVGEFNKIRVTFLKTSNNEKPAGFPCVAIAEFYLYDKAGNEVALTAGNFSSNATHDGEGSIDKLCDKATSGDINAHDWYWHSQWAGTPNPYGYHYLEIDLTTINPEDIDLSEYKIGWVTRRAQASPADVIISTGATTEEAAKNANSQMLPQVSTEIAKIYTIKSVRSKKFLAYDGTKAKPQQTDNVNNNCYWYFTQGTDGKVVMHNAVSGKVLGTNFEMASEGEWYVSPANYRPGVVFSKAADISTNNCIDDQGGSIGSWSHTAGDNEGTTWLVEEAPLAPVVVPALSLNNLKIASIGDPITEIEVNKWYILNNVGRGNYVSQEGNNWKMRPTTDVEAGNMAEKKAGYLFKITKNGEYYNIMSGNGKYFQLGENTASTSATPVNFQIKVISGDNFYLYDMDHSYAADGQETGYNFVGWSTSAPTNAGGNDSYRILPVELSGLGEIGELKNELSNAITKASIRYNSVTIKDEINSYSAPSDFNEKLAEIVAFCENIDGNTNLDDINSKITELEALIAEVKINLPVDGKFYRLRCTGNGKKYMQYTQNTNANRFDMISGDAGKTVNATFCYTNGGLVSYVNPLYINHDSNVASMKMETTTVTFSEATNVTGQYFINVGDRYIYGDGDNSDSGTGTPDNRAGYRWWLEEVNSLPFTFKKDALGYATFNAPVTVQLPEGVKAYTSEIQEGNKLMMTELAGGIVPAKTAVLLWNKSVADEDVTVNLNIVENVTFEGTNSFVGTVAAENLKAEKDCYSLQKGTKGKIGFYEKSTGTKGGFKAWIEMPKSSEARAFVIIFDGEDATGIKEALGLENENVEIYDLSGRRLDKPAKGVNVIGGKTVIVR